MYRNGVFEIRSIDQNNKAKFISAAKNNRNAVWKLTGICTVFRVILLFQTQSNSQSEVDR